LHDRGECVPPLFRYNVGLRQGYGDILACLVCLRAEEGCACRWPPSSHPTAVASWSASPSFARRPLA
jgi:hypothetical protein